jgi:universal stress protein A
MAMKQIVCCTDFSKHAETAFQAALELAQRYRAGLTLIHVLPPVVNPLLADTEWIWPDQPRESLLLKIQERMQQEYGDRVLPGIDCQLLVLDGHVSSEILNYLETHPVDLVVLGSYGLSGVDLVVFGSVANRVAHKAPCSVMIVREPKKEA